jgi:hypothetical protein
VAGASVWLMARACKTRCSTVHCATIRSTIRPAMNSGTSRDRRCMRWREESGQQGSQVREHLPLCRLGADFQFGAGIQRATHVPLRTTGCAGWHCQRHRCWLVVSDDSMHAAGWCCLSKDSYCETWRRATTDRTEFQPSEDCYSLSREDHARWWLLGPLCGCTFEVWHGAQHFLLRCLMRVRAELVAAERKAEVLGEQLDANVRPAPFTVCSCELRQLQGCCSKGKLITSGKSAS